MLLKAATLGTLDPPSVEVADIRIEAGRIVERARSLGPLAGEEIVDVAGSLVLPGLVNAHTHLYSSLARGMPPPHTPPRNFVEILERVWWRLDRALDAESIRLSGLVGGIEAALSGTTLLVDHHSSPNAIPGSLDILAEALGEVGLRSVLCYEVTDRNGPEGRDLGLAESLRFLKRGATPVSRGMVGAHASFTLSEQSLTELARASQDSGAGLHIHVAEDRSDVEDCQGRFGCGLVERLERQGTLRPGTILAHCVHLNPAEAIHAQERGCWIAHNPRSNMNNAVGRAPQGALQRAALGTDGMDQDLLAEARAAYLNLREAGRPDAAPAALGLLAGGHRLAAALFGLPFGKLDAGAPADLVVLGYRPPTPVRSENLASHLLFGVDRSHVGSVMVAGRFVVRDRRLTGLDVPVVLEKARRAAEGLWARMG